MLFASVLTCGAVLAQEVRITDDGSAEVVVGTASESVLLLEGERTSRTPTSSAALRGDAELLFDSGPFVTCTNCVEGGDGSVAQNNTLGNIAFGFNNNHENVPEPFRMAGPFEVDASGGWTLSFVHLYGYQTGSTTESSFHTVTLRIWNGQPGFQGSEIVFGDLETNVMVATQFTGVYRISETTLNTQRPIMMQTAEVDVTLQPGKYWLDWAQAGTIGSGPWQHPVTIDGVCSTGISVRWLSVDEAPHAWVPTEDGGSGCPQALPFQVFGVAHTISQEPGATAPSIAFETFPNPVSNNATVRVTLIDDGDVSLTVHDVLGREVSAVATSQLGAGQHELQVDLSHVASGVYVVRMTAGAHVQSRRITVAR